MEIIYQVLQQEFDLQQENIEIKKLYGYENMNYRITDKNQNNQRFLLKLYPYSKKLFDQIKSESDILQNFHLNSDQDFTLIIPKPIKGQKSQKFVFLSEDQKYIFRFLTFLEGKLQKDSEKSLEMYEQIGTYSGNLNKKLSQMENIFINQNLNQWDLQHLEINEQYLSYIQDFRKQKIIEYFLQQFKIKVLPKKYILRKQIIHGDLNDENIVIENNKISGIIDFGDICYSWLINDIAICCAYMAMQNDNFLEIILSIVKGHHKIYQFQEIEIEVLYYLIAGRLCVSLLNSSYSYQKDPSNDYIITNQADAWKMLDTLLQINPIHFQNYIRLGLGFSCVIQNDIQEKQILEYRKNQFSNTLSVSYQKPVYIQNAIFQYINDVYGNNYLDAYNNIYHVGHCHPKIYEAGVKQMQNFNGNTRYLNDSLTKYSNKLLSKFDKKLFQKLFFVNSGSAASDLSLRIAQNQFKNQKNRNKIVVMQYGYHGNTKSTIEVSSYKYKGKGGMGKHENIIELELPNQIQDENIQNHLKKNIKLIEKHKNDIQCFICEPIVGCGGQVEFPDNYLKLICDYIQQECEGLVIIDETQTGFGRLGCPEGQNYWGYQIQGIQPDIVIMGKPMGNGHPMAGIATSKKITEKFDEGGMEFFSSFGGNPVSCEIGFAVLEVLEKEKLVQNAYEVGNYWKNRLQQVQKNCKFIQDVRGKGLFLGVELIDSQKKPGTKIASFIKNQMRENKILISTDGPFDSVLKMKPPMCFSKQNADTFISVLEKILLQLEQNPSL